ncbi:MAG TPA: enoyl-CoA hydratase-related protein [Candidatus Limnocylindrales bacterium]|nr:enoyl-CoA hydratase-related protein [Candidatus Limnocylindrales bacterium]
MTEPTAGPAAAPEPVLLSERTAWGVRLTLNRPAKLNALSDELLDAVVDAVEAAGRDPDVRVVVLRGAGRAFCSGFDLASGEEVATAAAWRELLERDVRQTLRIWGSPKPVIAQVHGYCLAGGLELAMACDLVVAATDAQLGEPEIRFGSAPVTLLMPYLVGQKKTRELLLTGDLVSGEEAARIGLVNRAVDPDRLEEEVDALADRIARASPDVLALTKRMLNRVQEAQGFLAAVEAGIDLGAFVNDLPEQREFDAIVRRDGMKAALAWRDARYGERLAERGRATE